MSRDPTTPNRPPLSPAAQAVLDAMVLSYEPERTRRALAAAVLRAAADQVVPESYDPPRGVSYPEKEAFVDGKCVRNEDIRYQLLAIAAELKGHQ
jgi:hypothetical protein